MDDREFSTKKVLELVLFGILVIGIAVLIISQIISSGNKATVISVSTEAGIETQYIQQIDDSEEFVDTVAWIYANGYELVEGTYPRTIYIVQGDSIIVRVANNLEEYVSELLCVKYRQEEDLYAQNIPRSLIWKQSE